MQNFNPAIDLQFNFISFLEHDSSNFIQAKIATIDTNTVNERSGHAFRKIK